MSIVIPVGVDTADTSYLDMAAGSEWVKTTTSLIILPSTCSSHFHKGLHHWLKKVHPHSILLLLSSFTRLWCYSEPCYPEIIWFPVPCFSIHASTCQAQKLILWLYSIPSFHHFFPSHVYKVTANEKGICSPWKQGSYWACLNGQFSLDVDFNSTAHHRCSHILIFGVYCLLDW